MRQEAASRHEAFADRAKNFKGPLKYGSTGIGTGGHLAGELYKVMTGVKAEHIPYKGSDGPARRAIPLRLRRLAAS